MGQAVILRREQQPKKKRQVLLKPILAPGNTHCRPVASFSSAVFLYCAHAVQAGDSCHEDQLLSGAQAADLGWEAAEACKKKKHTPPALVCPGLWQQLSAIQYVQYKEQMAC